MTDAHDFKLQWPPLRRVAWALLFLALLYWAAQVDPAPGVVVRPADFVGTMGA